MRKLALMSYLGVTGKEIREGHDPQTLKVWDAVEADGYGHFLASYDGKEGEVTVEGEDYFIYRIN